MIDLPVPANGKVVVSGDWGGAGEWVAKRLLPTVARGGLRNGGFDTVLQLGDLFNQHHGARDARFLDEVDASAARFGVRIVTLFGNHDIDANHGTRLYEELWAANPGRLSKLRENVWLLPRVSRWAWADRIWCAVGGAASLDGFTRLSRHYNRAELVAVADVDEAATGRSDVLLTHDAAAEPQTDTVRNIRARNPFGFSATALEDAAESARRLSAIYAATKPRLYAHGHMHAKGALKLADGSRVLSLSQEWTDGNSVVVDLATLESKPLHWRGNRR